MPTAAQSDTLWIISLVIAVVVLLVVAALLTLILRLARRIDDGAKQVWVAGKKVAGCTIQLSRLRQTNHAVADIIESATGILHNAGRIAAHAQTCDGCPSCVVAAVGSQSRATPLVNVDGDGARSGGA